MKKIVKLFILVTPLFWTTISSVEAAVMNNENYSLEKRSVEIQPYQQVQTTPTPPQTEKPLFQGENYIVQTSLPEAFSFATSQEIIDFGKLSATNPVIRVLTLTINSPTGYQIFAIANHPLQKKQNITIPDTTCDNGACSEKTSALWNNTLTYGFGYSLESFSTDTYQQFPDASRNEPATIVAKGIKTKHSQIKITTKVNISRTQDTGSYANTITLVTTPQF